MPRRTILSTSLLALAFAGGAAASNSRRLTEGATFGIAEPDAMLEIRARAAAVDFHAWARRAPADYSAFASMALPRAKKTSSRLFDPTYTLPDDIRDQNGKVLFPKGYRVNVYSRIQVPGRYIVIGPSADDFAWLDRVARPASGDKVLVAGGNALLMRQQSGRAVSTLDQRFIERFGLQAVPCIVHQEGTMLRVDEYALP